MRMALVLAVSALVAGCSSLAGNDAVSYSPLTTPSTSRAVPTSPAAPTVPTAKPPVPNSAPTAGAAIDDVIAWIEAGTTADAADYRAVTRDGVSTPLADQVAFTTAGNETNCVTNPRAEGALACLVALTDPPPRPPDFPSAWKDNWVDFTGTGVDVGSPHGDPGPFADGTGGELPAGHTLAFGDYRCRADGTGLFCVDYAYRSAVRMSAAGVEGFGCLQDATPPPDIGRRLSC